MDKGHILQEIKRTANANGRVPLGMDRFFSVTGIKRSDWYGVHWARWSDAIREAGFTPNQLTEALGISDLLDKYATFALELGRLPTDGDVRLKARNDSTFPAHSTFANRFGSKSELVAQLLKHCQGRPEYVSVVRLCEEYAHRTQQEKPIDPTAEDVEIGFVYLVKSGRYYKIGMTNAVGRREYELAIQLPERATTVHVIRTDDPGGIEAYWHKRFEAKHKNGEWFDLDAADVAAFKRRKFM